MIKRSLSLFLARRFYGSHGENDKKKASGFAIRIATIGVALGLAVMIVSICVVQGFQNEIRSKLTGFTSHIMVLNDSSFLAPESYPIVADPALLQSLRGISGVERVQCISEKLGILKTNDSYQAISLKGIACADYDTTFLSQHLVAGHLPQFSDVNPSNQLVISQMQADALGLKVGSRIFAYFFEKSIKMRRFVVAGIYQTNMPQLDEHFALTDRATVNQLNNWASDQCSVVEIHLHGMEQLDAAQLAVGKLVNGTSDRNGSTYTHLSIREHPQTSVAISWLDVLNMNVIIILVLMIGVAGFTMISGLLILILERTQTIGILKALGMTNARIRQTFINYAAFIVLRGMFWGNIVGLGLVLLQQQFGWVELDPAYYYVKQAPVLIDPLWILLLNVSTLCLTVLALILPSYVISRIQPAKVIQFD